MRSQVLGVGSDHRISLVVSLLAIACLIGYAIQEVDAWAIAVVFLLPVVFLLLNDLRFGLLLFVAIIPLENVAFGDSLSLTKVFGSLALVCFLGMVLLRRQRIRLDASLLLMGLFVLWGMLSLAWTIDEGRSIQYIETYLLLCSLYLLITSQIDSQEGLDHLFIALSIGGLALGVSGVLEIILAPGVFSGRVSGISGNSNAYATMAICLLPSYYWILLRGKKLLVKAYAVLCMLLLLFTILHTGSRGGMLSIGIGLLAFIAISKRRVSGIALLLIAFIAFVDYAPVAFLARFDTIGHDAGVDRIRDLWPVGLTLIGKSIWIGHGVGVTNVLLPRVILRFQEVSVHSAPLALLIDLGVVGLALYLGFMLVPFSRLLAKRREIDRVLPGQFTAFYLSVFVAFLANWAKSGSGEINKLMWLFIGVQSVLLNLFISPEKEKSRRGRP